MPMFSSATRDSRWAKARGDEPYREDGLCGGRHADKVDSPGSKHFAVVEMVHDAEDARGACCRRYDLGVVEEEGH